MDLNVVARYLSMLKERCGLSYEAIAEKSGIPVSTIKNLCSGKTENPGLDTIRKIVYAMGGSLDEMFNQGKSDEDLKEFSIFSLKEMYEYQIAEITKMNETHINNIRTHYEQHRQDVKENYDKRLADKREIIEQKDNHIKSLQKEIRSSRILAWVCISVLVALLIAEVMNPNLGWLRF